MKAKLYKTEKENYVLVDPTKGTYDNGYMLGTSRESQYNKLSIKNCQAIERGYDLDELISRVDTSHLVLFTSDSHELMYDEGFKAGFQKALELMGDKKFSEEDMIKAIDMSRQGIVVTTISEWETEKEFDYNETQIIQSLQQTEWDVEIEMEEVAIGDKYTPEPKPKLDADGCLILKRI